MTEEPYRWLEAVENRREYVRDQLAGGAPVFAVSQPDGILLLGVGSGQSKVFELFDRHALAGLGHPADLEKVRQMAIDAAHLESFNRSSEDVSLRRLVSFGLSPAMKSSFEQIFNPPVLGEFVLAEIGPTQEKDVLIRLHYDGSYRVEGERVLVAAPELKLETATRDWLKKELSQRSDRKETADLLLQAYWCVDSKLSFDQLPTESDRQAGWRTLIQGRVVELAWLSREDSNRVRYQTLTLQELGL